MTNFGKTYSAGSNSNSGDDSDSDSEGSWFSRLKNSWRLRDLRERRFLPRDESCFPGVEGRDAKGDVAIGDVTYGNGTVSSNPLSVTKNASPEKIIEVNFS